MLTNSSHDIVLFQSQVLPKSRIIDYRDLRGTSVSPDLLPDVDPSELPAEGPFFHLVQTYGNLGENNLTSINRRPVDPIYRQSKPVFSASQDLVCLQRVHQGMIDVYSCGGVDQGFFKAQDVLRPNCSEYMFSVDSLEEVCGVTFS